MFLATWADGREVENRTILLASVTFMLVVLIFPIAGVYRSRRTRPLVERVPYLFLGWGLVIAILSLLGFATKSTDSFPREVVVTWAVTAQIALIFADVALGVALRILRARGRNSRRAVIAGSGEAAVLLGDRIRSTPEWGIRLYGFFDDQPSASAAVGAPRLGRLGELCAYVRENEITHVYVALPVSESDRAVHLLEELGDTPAAVYFVPGTSSRLGFNFSLQEMDGLPVYAVHETPIADVAYVAVKRMSDIVVAACSLILFLPLLAIIAAAIKLTSSGPVLFRQRRSGLNGRQFIVYKFRTMTVMDDGPEIIQANRNDPRCTRLGAFLRRYSLDELPQLVNVLQGSMSMVGPRPHALAHDAQYRKLIRGYTMRHRVKPGITGWAQIHGLRGETKSLDKMAKRVEFDLHYMRHWSLALDLKILAKTPFTLFNDKNAH